MEMIVKKLLKMLQSEPFHNDDLKNLLLDIGVENLKLLLFFFYIAKYRFQPKTFYLILLCLEFFSDQDSFWQQRFFFFFSFFALVFYILSGT